MSDDPPWYRFTVFYELRVKAFQDANGDVNGLIQRQYPRESVDSRV